MAAANPHEELKRFIQSAGRREALKKLQGFEFLIKKEDSVAFGLQPGANPILLIARQPDGLFAAFESNYQNNGIRLIQRGTKSHAGHAWRFITQRAAATIHHAAIKFTESAEAAPPQDLDHQLHRLAAQEAEVAAGIAQHTGAGPNANAIGNAAVRNLLGPENVANAIRCAGYNATLEHLNQTIIQGESLSEACRRNPRATALWLHLGAPLPRRPIPASEILRQGRQLLAQDASDDELDRLWEYAGRLSIKLFRLRPMELRSGIQRLVRLTGGQPPAYTLAKTIIESFHTAQLKSQEATAYIAWLAEQSNRPRRCRKTGSMQDTVSALGRLDQESVAEAMNRSNGNPEEAHRILTEHAPISAPKPKKKPRTRTAAGKLQAEQKRSMKTRAAELLSRPETIIALERFASEYPAVVCIPGEKAELHDSAGPDRRPRTALRRQHDGSILAEGTGRADYQLPEPGQTESRHRNKHPYGWSSTDAATLIRTAALQTLPPFQNLDAGAIAADRRFDQAFPDAYQPETVDRQWLTAVRSMINPETWRICRQAAPDPQNERTGLSRYSRAARSAAALAQTIETNPGAAAWFMTVPRPEPEPAPNHPGQIIAVVRDEFRRAGGRSWKTMAAMDPAEAAMFAEPGNETGFARPNPDHPLAGPPRRLAAYANMRYEAGGPPPPGALRQDVADALSDAARTACHRPGQALSRLAEELDSAGNLIQCLTLFIKESRRPDAPPEAELRQQTFQVADYLLDNGGRRPITARSWRGLLKNADRWHRRIIEENKERQRLQTLLRNSGLYRNWKSALPASNLPDGFIAVPADDEGTLSELGRIMNNCVGSYAERCLTHNTRIYQVRRENEPPARGITCELSAAGNGEWQAAQVAGANNRAPTGKESEACRELAARYGQARRSMGQKRHDQSGVKVPDPEDPAYRKYLELAKKGELDGPAPRSLQEVR